MNFRRRIFLEIFEILDGSEVNIRLLDPPVHEFLPKTKEDREKMAENSWKACGRNRNKNT